MKKQNKFEYVKVIQGFFGQGWEDVSEYTKDDFKNIKPDLKEYRISSNHTYRLINRRNKIGG
jgi:hypothetical protein